MIVAVFVLGGCGPQVPKEIVTCPGAESAVQALELLKTKPGNAVAFRASGKCRLQYYDKGQSKSENFNVKLWFNPPFQIYMQGEVALDGKAIVLGANETEFWLAVRPQLSSYWWGQWPQQQNSEAAVADIGGLPYSPGLILEGLGALKTDNLQNLTLTAKDGYDVLIAQGDDGRAVKRIYLGRCIHQIAIIEYLNNAGRIGTTLQLAEHKQLADGFYVPEEIRILTKENTTDENVLKINLRSIKPVQLSNLQKNKLFERPKPKGFKHIYKWDDGNMLEQLP